MLLGDKVDDPDAASLAQARAGAIRSAFLASGQFSESRVVIAESEEVESRDEEWVTLELSVAP